MRDRIQAGHLERKAVVYLRQSSLKQLVEHTESTTRQYALRERALTLGWPAERIDVIDSDLGLSGTTTDERRGFQRLAEDVAHGRVGAIFALEVSRLARDEADWQRLLDLCGLADVVIADEQATYAPREYDDRLLLGLKGTMSGAEQHWMQLRLQGAIRSKARRGELYRPPCAGYDWDRLQKKLVITADEDVRRAVRLVFERFRIDGSASRVMHYFHDNALELPTRRNNGSPITWGPARNSLLVHMLRNPVYAGAYVYGRREERRGLVNGEIRRRRVLVLSQDDWKVCIHDRHEGYITWEEYMANQKKLTGNRSNHKAFEQRGAVRMGPALLQGMLLCGRCGFRMATRYSGHSGRGSYVCDMLGRREASSQRCWSVPMKGVDEAVVRRFLAVAVPDELNLCLAVAAEAERQIEDVKRQWDLRVERAKYEARHAERRYKAVDPDNRVVARTLEKEWNEKLTLLEELEERARRVREEKHLELGDQDKRRILNLSKDLPCLWNADTTTAADRKNMLRMLIDEITLEPIELPARQTRMRILWKTGAVEECFVESGTIARKRRSPSELVDEIRTFMASGMTDREMSKRLTLEGRRTTTNRPWTQKAVAQFRSRYGLTLLSRKGKAGPTLTTKRGRVPR